MSLNMSRGLSATAELLFHCRVTKLQLHGNQKQYNCMHNRIFIMDVSELWGSLFYWKLIFSDTTCFCFPFCDSRLETINALDSKDNYSATSNNTKLVHWQLIGGLLHLVQRGVAWAGCGPAQSPAIPNVTAHPSTACVPITVL